MAILKCEHVTRKKRNHSGKRYKKSWYRYHWKVTAYYLGYIVVMLLFCLHLGEIQKHYSVEKWCYCKHNPQQKKMCHLKSELSIFWCPNPMSAACCLLESTGVLGRLVCLWHPVSDGASLWVVGNKAVSPQRLPVSSLYAKKKSYRIMSVICLFLTYFYCTVATSFFFVHDVPL